MVNISYTTLAGDNYCFFVILVIVFCFNRLRTNEKRILTLVLGFVSVATSGPYFCNISDTLDFHPIRAKFLNKFFKFGHQAIPPSS